MYSMLEHIIDSVGANLGTRTLAWAAGEISDLELYQDIKDLADELNLPYHVPIKNEELATV